MNNCQRVEECDPSSPLLSPGEATAKPPTLTSLWVVDLSLTSVQHRRLGCQSPRVRPVCWGMISLSWKPLSFYSNFKVPGRTWPQCFCRARAVQAGLGDALHHSTLTLSSWANRANSVHLESPCCLWAGFGDHQEFTPTVNASESLLSNTGHATCLLWMSQCTPGAQPGPGLWHMRGESQGLGCCDSCDLLRSTSLHKWRTWSTSDTSLSPLFLLKCFIQSTLEPLFSSLLAKAGQEDIQGCSSWPSAAKPICLPGFSLRRLSQSRVWSFFVILMTGCHTWEAYSFC